MKIAVLGSSRADARGGRALGRALERLGITVEQVEDERRWERARDHASDDTLDYVIFVDADAAPFADAFASLQRLLASRPALVGGRAVIGATQRFGAMLGPPRSGPYPFELVPIMGLRHEHGLGALVRGPVDVPQRGVLVVATSLIRAIGRAEVDPLLLSVDLAVRARAVSALVVCEPAISFYAEEESVEVVRHLLDLRRYADWARWDLGSMHRDPPNLRSIMIGRETRIAGNFRGYQKRPYPPIDVLLAVGPVAPSELRSAAATLAVGGTAAFCDEHDGDAVRRALSRTGDRYLLLAAADGLPSRAQIVALIEQLERSGRFALAVDAEAPPYRRALFHMRRLQAGGTLRGDGLEAILADAVERLPGRRLYAVGSRGAMVPRVLPAPRAIASYDVVFIAAAEPVATNQTLQSLVQASEAAKTTVVFPAGATTTRRALETFGDLRLEPDAIDPILAVGLNRALAACRSDAIAIVRDDAQLTRGLLARLQAAFARIPRLGAVVPRAGSADRPEGLPELSYRNVQEMQAFADRRATAFAREAMLVDVATVPIVMVTREALEIVGGFDEAYGFSRCGIEDFVLRLRSANYLVARCDDTYAHLFPDGAANSLMAPVDASPTLRERLVRHWSTVAGFDPERDRVPLRETTRPAERATDAGRLKVLVPIGDEVEWRRVWPLLTALAQAFTSADPIDLVVGLDGTFPVATTVAALRELLAAAPIPLDATLNVRVEVVADIAGWRDSAGECVRLAVVERPELNEIPAIESVEALRARTSVAAS